MFAQVSDCSETVPLRQRACWALEATDGVALLHAYNIMHADIEPENMALDSELHVCLIDFSGSSLGDKPSYALGSTPFFMPRDIIDDAANQCTPITELFALSSSFYQIVTDHEPWHEAGPRVRRRGPGVHRGTDGTVSGGGVRHP